MKNLIITSLLLLNIVSYTQKLQPYHKFKISKTAKTNLIRHNKHTNSKTIKQAYFNNKTDRPDLAAEHEFIMTMDPALGYVPTERLIKARKKALKLLTQKSAIPNVHWTERGPANVGGRTRAIMFDPNDNTHKKVWAGGVSGGLWFNNDITSDVEQWQKINDFWDNLAITTIAYNPVNNNEFYVGTGEGWSSKMLRGNGIWKTTDGGISWQHLTSTNNSNFYYIQKIVITNSETIIAATNSGLYISNDGGNSWQQPYITGFLLQIQALHHSCINTARLRSSTPMILYIFLTSSS